MTTVRIAHAEPRPGRLGSGEFLTRGFLVVLADDAGRRAVPIWMGGDPGGGDLSQILELARRPAGEVIAPDAPQELTARLMRAAGAGVTGVDIDLAEAGAGEPSAQDSVARIESRIPPGPTPIHSPSHVIVLTDDAGRRDLPLWLLGHDGLRLPGLFESSAGGPESAGSNPGNAGAEASRQPDELTGRLLRAAGSRVAGVDIDELGPEMTVTRIALDGPGAAQKVTARLPDGLALAMATGAPVRVADAVMDRLSVPAGPGPEPAGQSQVAEAGQALEVPERTVRDLGVPIRPR